MTPFRSVGAAALAIAAALALAPAASAQNQPGQPNLHKLHQALNLSASQEAAWTAFQASMAPDPEAQARERSAQEMMPTLNAPQRIDLSIAAMRADLQDMRRRGEALKTFYAALSPQQQAVFDRLTAPPRQ